MELQHGSLIRAMRLQMKRQPVANKCRLDQKAGARYSLFCNYLAGYAR